jgi:hypothetical protein
MMPWVFGNCLGLVNLSRGIADDMNVDRANTPVSLLKSFGCYVTAIEPVLGPIIPSRNIIILVPTNSILGKTIAIPEIRYKKFLPNVNREDRSKQVPFHVDGSRNASSAQVLI